MKWVVLFRASCHPWRWKYLFWWDDCRDGQWNCCGCHRLWNWETRRICRSAEMTGCWNPWDKDKNSRAANGFHSWEKKKWDCWRRNESLLTLYLVNIREMIAAVMAHRPLIPRRREREKRAWPDLTWVGLWTVVIGVRPREERRIEEMPFLFGAFSGADKENKNLHMKIWAVSHEWMTRGMCHDVGVPSNWLHIIYHKHYALSLSSLSSPSQCAPLLTVRLADMGHFNLDWGVATFIVPQLHRDLIHNFRSFIVQRHTWALRPWLGALPLQILVGKSTPHYWRSNVHHG